MNEQSNLQNNGERVKQLYFRLRERKYDLVSVPILIRQIIQNDMWRKFTIEKTGQVVEYDNFLEFVTQPPPEGLGATYKNLWLLCQDDIEVQEMLISLVPNEPIPFMMNEVNVSNKKLKQSRDFIRLQKEANKGNKKAAKLLQQVQRGAKNDKGKPLTAYKALVELGIRKPRTSISKTVPSAATTLQRMFSQKQMAELVSLLNNNNK